MNKLAVLFIILIAIFQLNAAIKTSAGTGTWATAGTWSPSGVPAATDTVVISGGFTVTIGANATCGGINIVSGSTLTINSGYSLTVSGGGTTPVTYGTFGGSGTLSASGGTARVIYVTGNWTFSGTSSGSVSLTMNGTGNQLLSGVINSGAATYGALIINKASGTVTLGSNITVTGSISSAFTLTAGTFDPAIYLLTATTRTFTAGKLRVGASTWAGNYSGAITEPAAGIIEYYAAGAQTVNNINYPGSLSLSGSGTKTMGTSTTSITGTLTLGGAVSVTTVAGLTVGNLVVGNGTTFTAAAFNLTVNGTTTVGGGTSGNLTFSSTTGTKTFSGLVTISAGGTWNNSANEAVTFSGGINNNGTFTAGTAVQTFNSNSQALTGTFSIPSITVTGWFFNTITLTNNGTLTVTTEINGSYGVLLNAGTGTLNINFAGVPGIPTLTATAIGNTVNYGYAGTQTVFSTNYYNLALSNSGVKTLQTGTTTINGNLTLSGSATTATAAGLTIGGQLNIGDGTTFTSAGFALTVTGATIVGSGTSGTLTISSATGTKQFTGLVTISAGGTWNNSGNSAINFRGGITNNGTFTAGTGVQTFNTNGQALTGTFSIPIVTVTTITLTNNGTLIVTTALSGTGGLTNGATSTLNINFTGVPGITTLTSSAIGNTINYGYAGTQTIIATTYYYLKLSGTGTKTLATGTTTLPANGTLELSGGATPPTFSLGGNTFTVNATGTTLIYSAAGAQTVNTAGEWNSNFQNVTINNSAGVTLGAARTINGTLTLTSGTFTNGVNLTLGSSATILRFGGRLAAAPNFGTSVNVNYLENGIQTTTGPELPASPTVLNNLTINTSHGVLLNAPATVKGVFTLTSGTITTTTNLLTFTESAIVGKGGGNDGSSFVDGPMAYIFTTAGLKSDRYYPIGKNGIWRPLKLTLNQTTATSSIYTAEIYNTAPMTNSVPPTLSWVSAYRHYTISENVGGSAFTGGILQILWGPDDLATDNANIRIAQGPAAGGGTWVDLGGIGAGTQIAGNVTSTNAFTSLTNSVFTLANATGGLNDLPIELSSFTSIINGRNVNLNWETKTEHNSNNFVLERTKTDGSVSNLNWTPVQFVKASFSSNVPRHYSFTDKNLQSGKYQYRLKMTDNDGTFKYSSIVEAEVAAPKNYELSQNFPNPFNPNTVISYSLLSASNVRLVVYNSLGQTVKALENGFKNAGSYSINFNANELPSGTYYYKIDVGQFSEIKKMILLK